MLVAGAAIFALDASAATAQDTTTRRPTSSQRIRIGKESGGEVTTVTRVDTVYSYRTDTLRLPGRTDTVVTTNTVTRVDTVQIPMPAFLREIGGLYFGVGGGSVIPAANFNDSDKPGWSVNGVLGVDPIGTPFGIRLTGAYANFNKHSYAEPFLESAKMMNVGLDLKIRALTLSPFNKRVHFYGIAGGTWNRFKNVIENNHGVMSVGDTFIPGNALSSSTTLDRDWHSGWGWNAGGGGEIGWGRTNLFIESRFSRFQGQNSKISTVPLIIGLSWF
jgi:opacity protein-like surface antigen